MASLGLPVKDILTTPGREPLEQLLVHLIVNMEGDQEITTSGPVTQAASLTVNRAFALSPSKDQVYTEWIVEIVQVTDSASIDPADKVFISLEDIVAGIQLLLSDSKPSQSDTDKANTWTWPTAIAQQSTQATTADLSARYTPIRLFRRVNGEPWRQLRIDLSTTASVGTRNFNVFMLYRRRPSTRV